MFQLFDPDAAIDIHHGTSLPHWFQRGASYFVTFRTEDSLPAHISRSWHRRRELWLQEQGISPSDGGLHNRIDELPQALRRQYHELFSREYLQNLDKGWGQCVLRNRDIACLVRDALLHFNGTRYHIGDFVIMPNHVHLIVGLLGATEIQAQCTSWKRYSARQINQRLGSAGRFWQEESFDHLIRSPAQFRSVQQYIQQNPAALPDETYLLYAPPAVHIIP